MDGTDGEAVLTYVDTTLFESDMELLEPGQWFNDKIIGFYFDFLSKEKLDKSVSSKVFFMNPSTMVLLAFVDDPTELAEALSDLQLHKRDRIFIPINNNHDFTQAGGSHWSLLVFERGSNTFFYFDSAAGMNQPSASATANKLLKVIHAGGKQRSASQSPSFQPLRTPQQQNGNDCGVYVVAIAEILGIVHNENPFKHPHDIERMLKEKITPDYITRFRQGIKELILTLAAESASK